MTLAHTRPALVRIEPWLIFALVCGKLTHINQVNQVERKHADKYSGRQRKDRESHTYKLNMRE